MDNLDADFIIETSNLEAEYSVNPSETFACSFELFASGTTWGSIDGEMSNQTDLWEVLQSKADTVTVEALSETVTNNYNDLDGRITSDHSEITNIALTIQSYGDIVSYDAADFATAAQGALADTAVQPGDLATVATTGEYSDLIGTPTLAAVATSGSYDDLTDKPTIPTVNDGELKIQVNGVDLATFTANQSSNTTANITVPDSATWGNITGTLSDQSDLQDALNAKQDTLTAGTGIDITSGTISVTSPVMTNNATGSQSIALGQGSSATGIGSTAYGYEADATSTYSMAIGWNAGASNTNTIAIGKDAKATAAGAIALGTDSENSTAHTFQVKSYELLDLSNGLIPDARISSNIARTADIPSLTNYVTTNTAQTISASKAFSQPLVIADNNGLASGTILSNKKVLQRSSGDNTLTLNNIDNKLRLVGSETRPKYSADGSTFNDLALYSDVSAINDLIPTAASVSNQLADKQFVNDSISTNTAYFDGSWATYADIPSTVTGFTNEGLPEPSNNNYLVVLEDETQDGGTWRYKYVDDGNGYDKANWQVEYEINETPLTQSQLDALNSGITAADVTLIGTAVQPGDSISVLNNDSGYITGIDSSDVITALGYTPYDSDNPNGYTSNTGTVTSVNNVSPVSGNVTLSIPTNTSDLNNDSGFITSSALTDYVTLDTAQNITGTKTFVGQKKIAFKQSGSSDKLGFTLYNNSGTEKGYLEYNPSNTVDSVPLMTLGNYASASAGITHVGFRKYDGVSSSAYNLLAPLASDAKTPFSLSTTYTNFYLPLGFTDGSTTVKAAKTGVVDLSSLGFALSSSLATVATSGDYSDLINKPSIPSSLSDLTVSAGSNITISGDTISATDTTYSDFTGCDSITAGAAGLVPAPSAGDESKFLKANGTWDTIPGGGTVDQVYNSTSANAQSGIAIAGAGFLTSIPAGYLQNTATGTHALTLLGTATNQSGSINIGYGSSVTNSDSVVIGESAQSAYAQTVAIGYQANANDSSSIAIGYGAYTNYSQATAIGASSQATKAGTVAIGASSQATQTQANAFGYNAQSTGYGSTALGYNAQASANYSTTLGHGTTTSGVHSIALGASASVTANYSIQIGYGTNNAANTLNVGFYNNNTPSYNWQLLDGTTGLIPDGRISSNIARTSDIPSITVDQTYDGTSANAQSGVAIEGELANYVKADVTDDNTGTQCIIYNNGNSIDCSQFDNDGERGLSVQPYGAKIFYDGSEYNSVEARDSGVSIYCEGSFEFEDSNGYITLSTSNNNLAVNGSEVALQSDLSSLADTDLSNLSATGKLVIDAQFVGKYAGDVINATAVGSYSYSLANYLPTRSNGETYLIYGICSIASNVATVFVTGRKASPYTNRTDDDCFSALISTNANGRTAATTFIIPILSTDTHIYAQIAGTAATSGCYVSLMGYRRLGNNS